MKARLLGGLFVAIVIALAMGATAQAVYFECYYWWACFPF